VIHTRILSCAALSLLAACSSDKKDESSAKKETEPKPAAQAPASPAPTPPPPAPAAEPKKITPAELPPALAKVYEATGGIDSRKGGFAAFHKAVIAKHGQPTVTVEMYGKPAYFWAAREGDACVKFGYPEPKDPKVTMWSTWQPEILQPPAAGLSGGEKMLAERSWSECVSYAEGKQPPK
jgi:hypothetical protein